MFRRSNTRGALRGFRLAAPVLLATAACSDTALFSIRPGQLQDAQSILLPDTFRVGTTDSVVILTIGDGCIKRSETKSTVQGLLAVVEPRDSVLTRSGCSDTPVSIRHRATLVFQAAGEATVRVVVLASSGSVNYIDRLVPVR